jgi:hypothetical protein
MSIADMMLALSSSTFGDKRTVSVRDIGLESDTSWLCRRASGGAGGVLRRREADGEGGSGVFPAASLSNILSLSSDSWLARAGAGGRGLLRSVCERCAGLELKNWLELEEPGVVGDAKATEEGSSRNSTFMSLPCREEGGGGFFLPAVLASARRSSSGSEISWDVRGDSACASCTGSNIDCRDKDDVSVLLPPSPNPWCTCACEVVGGVDMPSPAFPVISNLLNASTSKEARPRLATFVGGIIDPSLSGCSIVSRVFWNGFAGACFGMLIASSSDVPSDMLSNGSLSSCGIGVGGFAEME